MKRCLLWLRAIGNYIVKNTNKRVLYVTSDQFINDFLGLNKKDKDGTNFDYVDLFKDKYRNIDVLIIDDIQFLGNAPKTQNEFFHTFNALYESNINIQMISTSEIKISVIIDAENADRAVSAVHKAFIPND